MIAVVVPSYRPESLKKFQTAWQPLFDKHRITFVAVIDGDKPVAQFHSEYGPSHNYEIPDKWNDVIFNHTDAVRNFGFLAALSHFKKDLSHILTLDDDLTPIPGTDPIKEHIDAMQGKVPISWFKVGSEYTRGFPYGVRNEADIWISHGVWKGVCDWDGPTQLIHGSQRQMSFYKGTIPKGCLFPFSGMNVMFRTEALPWMYYAPMGTQFGLQRFADIWMGIECKRAMDELGKAIVTGYSTIFHERASNVFENLEQEAKGIKLNETFWLEDTSKDEQYFAEYKKCLDRWQEIVTDLTK